MPAPLAVTTLGPRACVPSMSRHVLTPSSVHLQTVSNATHSQLGGHARGVVQGKKVPLPFQPGSCSPASALFLIFLVFPSLS